MHTGDAEDQALFERLERELADVRLPRPVPPPGTPRPPGGMPRTRRMLSWALLVALGLWSLFHTADGPTLAAPVVSWAQQAAPGLQPEGQHVFLRQSADGPVRWSSCREIEVVVNDRLRPVDAWDVVERSVAEVAEASGLTITIVGSTDEQPSRDRPGEHPRYGLGWAPVLIAWTTPEVDPDLAGNTVGMGGGGSITTDGVTRYVTGQITLDTPQIEGILARPDGDAEVKAIVMHELAHVLGLGHVESSYEIMAEDDGPTELGPGDRAGLKIAGSGPCV